MPRLRWFGRSPVSRHLVKHYEKLSAEMGEYARPPWTAIAADMAKAGVLDAKGQPPSPNAVRDAFLRVKTVMEAQRAQHTTAPAVPTTTIEPPLLPPKPSSAKVTGSEEDDPDPPLPQFKLGKARQ